MLKRVAAIIAGLVLAFSLFISYSDDANPRKLVIWYVLTPEVLQIIVWIVLFFVATRLIYGPYKDYSKYFYNLFVKLFGDPKKSRP
jgi:Na+-transporting NADH:ubiquinone oxidoreductase subunit NqrB